MKYTDGQVTYSSSQIIDLEANNHKPSMENIPLSTYATAQAQPCDTAWPGSPEEQTSDQEQTKALEPRPTLAPRRRSCCGALFRFLLYFIGFGTLFLLGLAGVYFSIWYIVDKASAMR
ncbi:hypothetical protein CBS147343_8335 [Aspergillus niger]|uniref:Uncharacterized protein n=4 Tax=Aspergillus TaxID=5052 RepID=A0A370PHV1_ASPPH|nr:hypothetical protein CBS147346_8107 [Aspergillus niger]RDH25321.1 hypothetical protein M747DRAFT_301342 [Aspergillus niger ATCC 13496]RDK41776.1 hypothetical protein M752DRAFT_266461 [Aspergillus phoenicis ATCC 13157]KAI3063601.1 hypothetical protein CBS147343_8335 [Aspergillus niger]GLA31203.1 hypothetical protein AnigIFM63326_009646 [Aspergillus niger]